MVKMMLPSRTPTTLTPTLLLLIPQQLGYLGRPEQVVKGPSTGFETSVSRTVAEGTLFQFCIMARSACSSSEL